MERENLEKNVFNTGFSKGGMPRQATLRSPVAPFCLSLCLLLFLVLVAGGCSGGKPQLVVASSSDISDFDRCVAAGYRVLRSYPPRCVTPDGRVFTQDNTPNQSKKNPQGNICVDKCGNRTCEQIVCMSEGCPCPEDPVSCPRDCTLQGGADDVW